MDYTKQLIKAINDLTKAVNKNTEAIRENIKPTKTVDESIKERIINKRIWNSYVNYNYKDLCDVSDREIDLYKRGMSVYNDDSASKAYQPENGVLNTDGLGDTNSYERYGRILPASGLLDGYKTSGGSINTSIATFTKEEKEALVEKLLSKKVNPSTK